MPIVLPLDTPDAAFISLCFASFAVAWIIGAFFSKRTRERSPTLYLILFAVAIWVFLASGISHMPDVELWPYTRQTGLVADIVVAFGLFFLLWARITLGTNWSGTVTIKENHELITTGPYAIVRHPIYTGMLVMLFGVAILTGHAIVFGFVAVVTVAMWVKSLTEEGMMTKEFPDAYPAYRQRVPALIPFIF
jgi:protein-S-isoprenylcysteine O-methyltransferase Ste14